MKTMKTFVGAAALSLVCASNATAAPGDYAKCGAALTKLQIQVAVASITEAGKACANAEGSGSGLTTTVSPDTITESNEYGERIERVVNIANTAREKLTNRFDSCPSGVNTAFTLEDAVGTAVSFADTLCLITPPAP